ncbi:MAG: DUF3185 family protein [Gammaproteobacteria bacterium]|nr:DUF3185 family protein [Gammaproteobacteria bacterium]MDH5778881.1 DUF3185 family protein [Gammaproteobacteria bacterium]
MARRKKANMPQAVISLALIIAGVYLIIWGYNESRSLGSHVTRFFSGNATQETMIYYISGTVCLILGVLGLTRK